MLLPDINTVEELLGLKKFDLPYKCDIDIRFINGFCVYQGGKSYWVIKGKFPIKIAEIIDEKADLYGIRINGNYKDSFKRHISHKRLEDEIENYRKHSSSISIEDFTSKCTEIEKDVLNNDYENCYTEFYHIDTLEGLKYVVDLIKSNNLITHWFL